MSQFNRGDEDAAYYRISGDDDLNSNGVGKDSVDGLNNYVRYAGARAIAYSPIAGDIPSNAIDTQSDTKWEPLDNTSDNFKLKLGKYTKTKKSGQ